jgi:hypothetical protein
VAEWLKAHAWKACLRETVTWVRIPLSPPAPCLSAFASLQVPPHKHQYSPRYQGYINAFIRPPSLTIGIYLPILWG